VGGVPPINCFHYDFRFCDSIIVSVSDAANGTFGGKKRPRFAARGARGGLDAGAEGMREGRGRGVGKRKRRIDSLRGGGHATFERVWVRGGSGQRRLVIASRIVAGAWEVSHQSIVSITISDSLIPLVRLFRTPRTGPSGANGGRGSRRGGARDDLTLIVSHKFYLGQAVHGLAAILNMLGLGQANRGNCLRGASYMQIRGFSPVRRHSGPRTRQTRLKTELLGQTHLGECRKNRRRFLCSSVDHRRH
jgi:hypothetical protein